MTTDFPRGLSRLLSADTATAWRLLARILNETAYLVGGTAVAVHLEHRVSRDLDFFFSEPFEPADLERSIAAMGDFVRTQRDDGTLGGVLGKTKVQFLSAEDQTVLEPFTTTAGIQVAGLGDLLATKLKVVGDRGEMRDYFDLMTIERAGRVVEEGIGLYRQRYRPADDTSVWHIVRGLGYFDDVADDPGLPVPRAQIEAYWRGRLPEIIRALGRSR